jgi:glycosyltransferase involved in cell wall biosynthesis
VLHTYLLVGALAKARGSRVVVEFHEVLDTAEDRIPWARAWVKLVSRYFFRLADGFVIHSESDRPAVASRYNLRSRPCVVIPHGPLDHHASRTPDERLRLSSVMRAAPPGPINLLFFGLIRPYKGLEDLVRAFDLLNESEIDNFWLTIVGETWEGWQLPLELARKSRYRHRITLVNRFVTDDEVVAHFAAADAVVLPYLRSSASSPAQVAMSNGLPLIITAVGGLPEAVKDYKGAILVPPQDPEALTAALRRVTAMRGQRFEDPHSWERTVRLYSELLARLEKTASRDAATIK